MSLVDLDSNTAVSLHNVARCTPSMQARTKGVSVCNVLVCAAPLRAGRPPGAPLFPVAGGPPQPGQPLFPVAPGPPAAAAAGGLPPGAAPPAAAGGADANGAPGTGQPQQQQPDVRLVWTDEDCSMEERRAMLPKYAAARAAAARAGAAAVPAAAAAGPGLSGPPSSGGAVGYGGGAAPPGGMPPGLVQHA